ncbi:MAG TPA: acyl carrier protein [Anaerovoracaceae bacterium]|nr:acyl carrier protein [Anaerovoracaceae bacterium]
MDILEKIKPIFKERYLFEGELSNHMRLKEDLGLDSIDFIDIVTMIEEKFQIEISDERFLDLETVGDVVKYIESFNS